AHGPYGAAVRTRAEAWCAKRPVVAHGPYGAAGLRPLAGGPQPRKQTDFDRGRAGRGRPRRPKIACSHAVRKVELAGKEIWLGGGDAIDGSKIILNFCEKKECDKQACYCCPGQPDVCYNTMDSCRQNCPPCAPKCVSASHGSPGLLAAPVAGG
ncbi:hypothetical protein EJB05_30624, partial [Eragrostis curvula]